MVRHRVQGAKAEAAAKEHHVGGTITEGDNGEVVLTSKREISEGEVLIMMNLVKTLEEFSLTTERADRIIRCYMRNLERSRERNARIREERLKKQQQPIPPPISPSTPYINPEDEEEDET